MIIDIHHHAVQLRTEFKSPIHLKDNDWKKVVFYRTWLRLLQIDWKNDTESINNLLIEKQISLIEDSVIDHFVMLPLDDRYELDGTYSENQTDLSISNEQVLDLSTQSEKIIPAFSVHPYRKDALEQIEEAAHQSVALIKWYQVFKDLTQHHLKHLK